MESVQTGLDTQLLQDLLTGLSAPVPEATVSVGLVGCTAYAPQPPAHCRRACLGPGPEVALERGCAYLRSAAQGAPDTALLQGGCCQKGYRVAAQPTLLGDRPAVLLTVEGRPVESPTVTAPDLEAHASAAERLVQRIGQLAAENAGFANEVLQNYEQLNLIFDFTQQIAHVTEVPALERLLTQRITELLHAEHVCIECSDGTWRGSAGTAATPPKSLPVAELLAWTAQVRAQRRVEVREFPRWHVIVGPLVRSDERVEAVCAFRASNAAPFNAGEMMLFESVLSFGGQIVSNTELHARLRRMSLEVVRAMVAAIDKKDRYTSGHSERLGFLARLTACELGLSPAEQQNAEWAGLLHDVGKIGVPEEVLCKPGKLTPEEFEAIKLHPGMGYEILKPIESFEAVLEGVLYHHEYPDGSGYPCGLRGDAIPMIARIIHVVDTFDALTSTRSYRRAFSFEKALEIMRADYGTRIDARVAEAFVTAFQRYIRTNPADYAARFPCSPEYQHDHA